MNKWVKWGGIAVIGLVVLGKMAGGSKDNPPASVPASAPAADAPAAAPAEPTEAPAPKGVTKAQFDAIATGATFEEVVAAIGQPKATMSESEIMGVKSASYQWEGEGFGANIIMMFSDGKLMTKSQFGLK